MYDFHKIKKPSSYTWLYNVGSDAASHTTHSSQCNHQVVVRKWQQYICELWQVLCSLNIVEQFFFLLFRLFSSFLMSMHSPCASQMQYSPCSFIFPSFSVWNVGDGSYNDVVISMWHAQLKTFMYLSNCFVCSSFWWSWDRGHGGFVNEWFLKFFVEKGSAFSDKKTRFEEYLRQSLKW